MKEHFSTYYNSPVGWLKITGNTKSLQAISFVESQEETNENVPQILQETVHQLKEYFDGKRETFQLNLAPEGTDFQKRIWKLVSEISFGETASYLDIAQRSGSEKNTRAVGLANGKNPIPIVIPCHRIIGTNGKLTGYAGGLDRKRWLLLHEQNHSKTKNRLF